ncbi:hypothetical protein J6590_020900 [Homalodisca vitripennis]|nr:hypothetical protein J6590_020900 [Homalodisca vitripennis]
MRCRDDYLNGTRTDPKGADISPSSKSLLCKLLKPKQKQNTPAAQDNLASNWEYW